MFYLGLKLLQIARGRSNRFVVVEIHGRLGLLNRRLILEIVNLVFEVFNLLILVIELLPQPVDFLLKSLFFLLQVSQIGSVAGHSVVV